MLTPYLILRSSDSEEDARNSACSRRDGSGRSPSLCEVDQGRFSAACRRAPSDMCSLWQGLPAFSLAKNAENAGVHP